MRLKIGSLASPATRNYYRRIGKYAVVDFLIVVVAYTVAVSAWTLNRTLDLRSVAAFVVLIAIILIAAFAIFRVYQRIWSRTSGHEVTVILNAVLVATGVDLLVVLLLPNEPLPLPVVLVGNVLALVGFVALRYRSRLASSLLWRWKAVVLREFPKLRTRVLIIGAGESGQTLAWRLKHRFSNGNYQVVGFIDDDPDKQNMYVEGCRVIGTRKDIVRLAESLNVDMIVVAVHNITGRDFRDVLTACENTSALIKVVPHLEADLINTKESASLLRDVQAEDLIGRSPVSRHEGVDLSAVMTKVILITGAAGSIGSELCRQIMQYNPTKVILLDNNESGLHDLVTELRARHPDMDFEPALVDIWSRSSLHMLYERHRPQIVFHAAAYKHVPMLELYPLEALRVNIGGTRNVAELAHNFQVERFVLISTDKAVNPTSIMGASKRICELMLLGLAQRRDCRTLFSSVRFGNVLGSRGSVVPTFNRQIDNGGPVTVTHQDMTRYFMSIPEAVNLIIHAACLTQGNDIFVLRMGEDVRIVELAERMIRLRGLRPYKDIEIQFTGIRPGEKMHEDLFHSEEQPVETIHPNILKVDNGSEEVNWGIFWTGVDQLTREIADSQTNMLGRLLELIEPPQAQTVDDQRGDTNVTVR